MKTQARVVIVGGGAMGVGLLYHLALEGWTDIMLVEKGELTSGSTWHAAGLCPHFIGSLSMAKIHFHGSELYPKLEELTGQHSGWHGCGGIRLALTDEEVNWFHYVEGIGRQVGFDLEVIGPDEIKRQHPFLDTFGVKAGARTFTDGHVDPAGMTNAMAAGARALGAQVERRCQVTDIKQAANGEWQVITEKGTITCEHVVNAAGSYCDIVGAWSGLKVPITNMLHHYVVTEPKDEIKALSKELPVVRDPYSSCYIRQEQNGIMVGIYETETATDCFKDGISWDFESELLPPELERLEPWLLKACERMPLFGEAGIRRTVAGAITHTPDGTFLLGPAPGVQNYWMCCGAAIGICQGAGAGKYLAQWMVHGTAEINMAEFDPRRFGDWSMGAYCDAKAIDEYQHMYQLLAPGQYREDGRPMRISPLYQRLLAKGAVYGEAFGWERPKWFDKQGVGERYSFRRTNWQEPVMAEARAVREHAGVMDLTSFAKFDVTGAGARAVMEQLFANTMPRKAGGIALGHMLNDAGSIESEAVIARLADDHYYVVSGATSQIKDLDALRFAAGDANDIEIRDVTDAFGALALAGPKARDILAALTDADLSNKAFPWLTGKEIIVAGHAVRALRVSYVGELGWELHAPMQHLAAIYDAIVEAGGEHGLVDFGLYAMNALRMEKAYKGYGGELTNEITLAEASMGRFFDADKGAFKGREAALARNADGLATQCVYLTVEAGDADCLGNEPVMAEGRVIGVTTGGAFGPVVGKSLAFAYVEPAFAAPGTEFDIRILGEMRKARVEDGPLYDRENARPRM